MANPEHVALLKRGVTVWNEWRKTNEKPNRILADLSGADLSGANLRAAEFGGADLSGANLRAAELTLADLSVSNLSEADLSGADLTGVNLHQALLRRTNLTRVVFGRTHLGDVDLSYAMGLDTCSHRGPSSIHIDTIFKSHGQIPELFLRGAGVPEPLIANMKALVGAMSPIQFYSCFISYSGKDHGFADRLHTDLQSNGVRSWFAPEDLKIGEKFRTRVDESIRMFDKLLIVLSKHSIRVPGWRRKWRRHWKGSGGKNE